MLLENKVAVVTGDAQGMGRANAIQTDIADSTTGGQMVARAIDTFGKIDILVNVEDIAGPALFPASVLSDFVTGQTICSAGGQTLLSHEATSTSNSI